MTGTTKLMQQRKARGKALGRAAAAATRKRMLEDFLYNFKDYPRGLKYAANIIIYLSTGFHFFLWEISKARYKVLLPQLNEANPNALLLLENDMDSDYYRYMCQLHILMLIDNAGNTTPFQQRLRLKIGKLRHLAATSDVVHTLHRVPGQAPPSTTNPPETDTKEATKKSADHKIMRKMRNTKTVAAFDFYSVSKEELKRMDYVRLPWVDFGGSVIHCVGWMKKSVASLKAKVEKNEAITLILTTLTAHGSYQDLKLHFKAGICKCDTKCGDDYALIRVKDLVELLDGLGVKCVLHLGICRDIFGVQETDEEKVEILATKNVGILYGAPKGQSFFSQTPEAQKHLELYRVYKFCKYDRVALMSLDGRVPCNKLWLRDRNGRKAHYTTKRAPMQAEAHAEF